MDLANFACLKQRSAFKEVVDRKFATLSWATGLLKYNSYDFATLKTSLMSYDHLFINDTLPAMYI